MDYKAAYLHMFNQLTTLADKLENLDEEKEKLNVPTYIKKLQIESEEICICSIKACKAPRSGSTM